MTFILDKKKQLIYFIFHFQVSVISPSTRTHYLNITPGNIALIYSSDREGADINKRPWSGSPMKTSISSDCAENLTVTPTFSDIIKDSEKELSESLLQRKESNKEKLLSLTRKSFSSPLLQNTPNKSHSFSFKSPLNNSRINNSTSFSPLFSPQSSPQLSIFSNKTPTSSCVQQNSMKSKDRASITNNWNATSLFQKKDESIHNVEEELFFSDDDEDLLMCDISNEVVNTEHIKADKNASEMHNLSTSGNLSSVNKNINQNFDKVSSEDEKAVNSRLNSSCSFDEKRDHKLSNEANDSEELFTPSLENKNEFSNISLKPKSMERDSRIQLQSNPVPANSKVLNDDFWDNGKLLILKAILGE